MVKKHDTIHWIAIRLKNKGKKKEEEEHETNRVHEIKYNCLRVNNHVDWRYFISYRKKVST